MKRFLSLLMAVMFFVFYAGCACKTASAEEAVTLRFSDSIEFSRIEALEGKQVMIIGYMATLSPLSGDYLYLMNLPYQSCPFCVPNTTQLANTMAVFARGGEKFAYTDQAIRVTGRMELGDFTDDFGYEYNYRIADARYEVIDLTTVSSDYGLWQSIASDGVVPDLYAMFDYLYFLCQWPYYSIGDVTQDGFYLYPGDVDKILEDDGVHGYARNRADDYFPKLIARVEAISDTGLTDLTDIIKEAKALEEYALNELNTGEYTYDEEADQFSLNNTDELNDRFHAVYMKFAGWITKWEL